MTTEALRAPVSLRDGYTAQPLSHCLNGCDSHSGDARSKVLCEPGKLLCPRCLDRLDTWLRQIPDAYALLPHVVEHGTVAADPGTKRTKRPDPPAPMRLEVIDLLDSRNQRGVLGQLQPWGDLVRDQRRLTSVCMGVASECKLLLTHLPWIAEHDWSSDLYDEIRTLHRTLQDTVGEYRPKPVGKCARLEDGEVCGGALVMDRHGVGVHCLSCPARYEASHELRELGLVVGRMLGEAS
jgi:hypothetical protein